MSQQPPPAMTKRVRPQPVPPSPIAAPPVGTPPHLTKSFRKTQRVQLSPEHLQQMQQTILLIKHHQTIITELDSQVQAMLLQGYQIDLADGWQINLATGGITRRDG